jgi:hypothetical protein
MAGNMTNGVTSTLQFQQLYKYEENDLRSSNTNQIYPNIPECPRRYELRVEQVVQLIFKCFVEFVVECKNDGLID